MRKTILLAVTGAVFLTGLLILITGCDNQTELSVEEIREFADIITEDMLQAANTGDYVKYSSHLDNTMKAAMSEYNFSATNTMIQARIGNYLSKEFWKTEPEGNNIIVYYKARYTFEPDDVEVKVIFSPYEDNWYVAGVFYSSPLLSEE